MSYGVLTQTMHVSRIFHTCSTRISSLSHAMDMCIPHILRTYLHAYSTHISFLLHARSMHIPHVGGIVGPRVSGPETWGRGSET